jgi:MFS family permease
MGPWTPTSILIATPTPTATADVHVHNQFETGDEGLAALLAPRDDLVLEKAVATGVFELDHGPFTSYQRTVTSKDAGPGRHRIEERIEMELAIPIWGGLFRRLIRRTARRSEAPPLRDPDDPPHSAPWWAPSARLDARAAQVLSRLCGLSLLAGYLGTIITQTITFAADDFGASKAAQGTTLAAIRFGVLLSLVLAAASDKRGRKRLLQVSAVGGVFAAAAGALSPSLLVLGSTQTLSRAFSTTLALLITVMAAEEMPARCRAYAASVLSMTAALGAGVAVMLLPLNSVIHGAWRIVYVVPLLGLPFFFKVAGALPESRRFARPHVIATLAGHRGRLLLLATSAFFGLLFLAPVTQFQNDYLRHERGFTPIGITLFTLLTNTPGGIGIVVGGKLADLRGRRPVGAIGTVVGATFLAIGYQVGGAALWVVWIVGTIIAAMCVPALGVYGPELFPTSLRGRANGIITLAGVIGSGVGLILAGRLADHFGRYGPGFALLALGPLVVSLLVIFRYPETAGQELEALNPEDAPEAIPVL